MAAPNPSGTATIMATPLTTRVATMSGRRPYMFWRGFQVSAVRTSPQDAWEMKSQPRENSDQMMAALMTTEPTAAMKKSMPMARSRRCRRGSPDRSSAAVGPGVMPGPTRLGDEPSLIASTAFPRRGGLGGLVGGERHVAGVLHEAGEPVEVEVDEAGHGRVLIGLVGVDVHVQRPGQRVAAVGDGVGAGLDALAVGGLLDAQLLDLVARALGEGEAHPAEGRVGGLDVRDDHVVVG